MKAKETFTGKRQRNPSVCSDLMLEEAQKLTMINNINIGRLKHSALGRCTIAAD